MEVFAKLANKTITDINVRFSTFKGKIPIAKIPKEVITLSMIYHFLAVSVVSTNGAQRNFKIFGNNVIATIGATCTYGIPAFVKRKPIVTLTYPIIAPNGRNKNIKTIG